MLNQKLQQKLLQKLSPQQILLMKLLQIPTISLDQRIKQEIEENPALEDASDPTDESWDDEKSESEFDEVIIQEQSLDENHNDHEEFRYEDYFDADDIPQYKLKASNTGPDDQHNDIPFAETSSFSDALISQLGMHQLDEKQIVIGHIIIGNIDDSGYLQREITSMVDDLMFSHNLDASEDEIRKVLAVIQEFDPPGIGARNLQECLHIQLRRKEERSEALKLAILIIDKYFDEFTRKHFDKIIKRAHIEEAQLKSALDLILKLNPKPGNTINESSRGSQYIIPDFIIHSDDGDIQLTVNSRNTPELRVSRTYQEMMEDFSNSKTKSVQQKEAVQFIRQKLDAAKWFIDAIKQRQNTLYVTMSAIMEFQRDYFLTGDETKLRPMILKDIAEIVTLDISTVSRVANSKYVQTPYGTFLLKSFFSESLQNESGEEVSTREIKKILNDCIDAEEKEKPLTDEELTEILKQKGYNIARRTVAKYREQLNIPVARLRKAL
jgi:RNA polymerase sigma-54 factor